MKALVKGIEVPFSPGIHREMNREQYDGVGAYNQSLIKHWIDTVTIKGGCPKKFKHQLDTRNDREKSDSLIIGSAVDTLLLEPDAFDDRFVIIPADAPKRPTSAQVNAKKPTPESVAALSWWKKFEGDLAGRDILTADQHDTILAMVQALGNDEKTADVFQYCEKTVLQAELNGLPCKGEVDLFCENTEYIFDLKTTADASRVPFGKAAWQFGYHYQAAFYLKLAQALGMDKTTFCFIAVENVEPYCVAAYTIDFKSDALQYAWKQINAAMQPLNYHMTRNLWPDHSDYAQIKFPGFSRGEMIEFQDLI